MSPVRTGPVDAVIVAEDSGHFRIADLWIPRVVQEHKPYTADHWEHVFRWCPAHDTRFFHKWNETKTRASAKQARQVRVNLRKSLVHAGPDALEAAMFRRALVFTSLLPERPTVVVLARDVDRRSERRDGFRQACDAGDWPFTVVGLLPDPESEAWYVAGFRAENEEEEARLRRVIAELGFNPTRKPHELTSTSHESPKDAKRVCTDLAGHDAERIERCLSCPFEDLRASGAQTGICDFLDDVLQRVVPLF